MWIHLYDDARILRHVALLAKVLRVASVFCVGDAVLRNLEIKENALVSVCRFGGPSETHSN